MDKGFVLTGAVFSILIVAIVGANYLLLTKRDQGASAVRNLKIDLVYNTAIDLTRVLADDKNNLFSDLLFDIAKTTSCDALQANPFNPPAPSYVSRTFSQVNALLVDTTVVASYDAPTVTLSNYVKNKNTCTMAAKLAITFRVKAGDFVQKTVTFESTKTVERDDQTAFVTVTDVATGRIDVSG